MPNLSESDLTYLELDTNYFQDKPVNKAAVQALLAEVKEWRGLGESPDAVLDAIYDLESAVDVLKSEVEELEQKLDNDGCEV